MLVLFAAICCATFIVIGVETAIDVLAHDRGTSQATLKAREMVARANVKLQRVTSALKELVAVGVGSCRQTDIEAMRRAVYTTTPVKEVALVDGGGAVLCSHHGFGSDHKAMTAEQTVADSGITVSMVRFGEIQEPALRLRHPMGQHYLAALVPAEIFEADDFVAPAQGLGVRLFLAGVPSVLHDPGEPVGPRDVRVIMSSNQYPISVEIVRTMRGLKADAATLVQYTRAGGFVMCGLVIALALSSTRPREDPVGELRAAIAAGEIVPYYQPVMDIAAGRLIGCEVLVRWRRPNGELISPGAFVPLAESSGLIFELTLALMRAARDEMAGVYASRPGLKLGFNIHADHFVDDRIVQDIQEIFGHSSIQLPQIMLEVTERAPLADLAAARRCIAALQAFGVKVAIDDVGTGHSGLNYLLKLGVDVIKIDKMFVDAIGTERYSNAIIDTLAELGRTMKIDVIAEGVESFEQVEYLREHGIHMAQGYVFAPALPGQAYIDLVEAMCHDPLESNALKVTRNRTPLPRYISARNRQFG
ncbi:EAL domain-containing protein [Blastochloris sulfoviridis]|uniref:cyclic-guanylate-specific phosphodiesterase n=1 Tax=Blastochloris sulfoviridis TaxID=50712 RepID=A0A5M6HUE5_9HYPH|nr:EAL domain-containing protein [Blastochloris sulfoviridis]KAA5599496.1 EAL domain-containing protein [Blastochloris sulfoviridis]